MNKPTKYSFLIFGTMFAQPTTLADVIITGTTFQTINNIIETDKIEYKILPNVKITVSREGTVFEPKLSDTQGIFTLKVKSGGPFKIVFKADNRMPEVQQLAGIDTYEYNIAVVLEGRKQLITEACKNYSTRQQEKTEEKIKGLEYKQSQVEKNSDEWNIFGEHIKILQNISITCQDSPQEPGTKTEIDNKGKNPTNTKDEKENETGKGIPPPVNISVSQ